VSCVRSPRFVPPALVVRAPDTVVPLSFMQQRLWFIEQLEPGSAAYNVSVMFRLRGRLDHAALHNALQAVVNRHAALRTRFTDVLGEARQVVVDDFVLAMPIDEVREADVAAVARGVAQRAFDLATGPLVRVHLLAIDGGDHALIVVAHHSVCDQWSVGILIGEAAAFYRGEGASLHALAVSYPDFALWQRGWMTADALAPQLAYWRAQLADIPDGLDLPSDRPRPATRSGRGARLFPRLPRGLVTSLIDFSRRERVTLYMTLLAAFDALLWRYTGQSDVVTGAPIAGRNRHELEGLVGFFANTLVLRVGVDGERSFRDLVQRVRAVCLDAYAHQDVPFEQLVDAIKPTRDLSRTPIFEVMFGLQTPFPHVELGESTLAPTLLDAGTATFDLTVSWELQDGELAGWVEYNTDLFDAPTVERMIDHYRVLLEAAVERPDDRLAALPLLGAAERDRVLYAWNRTHTPPPRVAHVDELFDEQARRTPDAIAVLAGDEPVTYRELDQRAERWAAILRARGCGPGARVALALSRGVAFPTMVLAVLKAGAAYVPLDPSYPADRLAFMIRDCGARVLISESAVAASLAASAAEILLVEAPPPIDHVPERRTPSADDLAYVIYTSGSTGKPKGVAMPHRAVVNLITWQAARSPEPMRTLQFASPSFDVSFQELFATWANGGCLVLASEDERRDPDALLRRLAAARVERLFLPFVALHQLAEAAHGRPAAGLALREVITAGEQLRITPAIAALFTQLPACRLYNQYGPTETHLASELPLTGAPSTWDTLPSIGRPIANVRIYILDADRQPVPIGVPGEAWIVGAGVARGYLGRDELTAERFVDDPFAGAGERMYKTGDRVKYLATGELVFLGRADDQVKLRGYRIELGEIEAALGSHPAIREAAVIVRHDGGVPRLVGYVTCTDPAPTIAMIKDHLRARLPDYMIPAAIVVLPAIPLSPNGKVDRKALPRPDDDHSEYVAPNTAIEAQVAAVWAAVLGIERISVTESFFEAGGHSLLATQVVSRLRAVLAIELPVRALFDAPTIRDLAAKIATISPTEDRAIPRVDRAGALPLSFAQQRLWFLAQLDASISVTYHIPMAMHLHGPLDIPVWQRSLDTLWARHEALRTVFVSTEGQPRIELLSPTLGLPLRQHDLQDASDPHASLRHLCEEEVGAPFDLARGPLIRARLVRLAEHEHVFMLTQHHIVSDGWSIGVLIRELSALYTAFMQGQANPLWPLTIEYPDYAVWQRQWLVDERLATQVDYWRRTLADAPVLLTLPTDRPRPPQQSFVGASVPIQLDAALTLALKRFSQQHGTTVFMTLMTAWAAVLARLSGQDDLVIGTPTANRNRVEIEPLIGFFVNTLALRIDLSHNPSVAELLARVRQATVAAQDHQDLPFEQVVEVVQPARHLDHTPLFQVMFAWQNNEVGSFDLPGLRTEPVDMPFDQVKFDLELALGEADGGIIGSLRYATALFNHATIVRHRGYLVAMVSGMVADAASPLKSIPILSATERHHLLQQWNDTGADYDRGATLHGLFEARSEAIPDAEAIRCRDVVMTYGELNRSANRLAHALRARGVVPGDRVAACVTREPVSIVALMGILKAGAAYVPVDPAYPEERVRFIVDDAQPRLVLCDAAAKEVANQTLGASHPLVDVTALLATDAPEHNPSLTIASEDLAYIIYTSGSTGRPKGVMGMHRPVVNLIEWIASTFAVGRGDIMFFTSSLSFDLSVYDIFGILASGGCIRIATREELADPETLAAVLLESDITFWDSAPAVFQQLIPFLNLRKVESAPTLRLAFFSGDWIPLEFHAIIARHLPNCRMIGLGGATEASVWSNYYPVDAIDPAWISIPYGRPIQNARYYVLDESLEPVPSGTRGDLYIGGECLAAGYFRREDLTAERFLPDPFSAEPGARMYKTGDLARYLPDGNLVFLGRNDHQVKIRGFRIEPGEIEARLTEHPAVREAVVLAREDVPGDKRLVAYLTTAPEDTAVSGELAATLRSHLSACLPDYMVPAAFVPLDALPLTPNGKLDRKALPAPGDAAYARWAYEPPQGEIEQTLAALWEELLGLQQVSRHDNFFALGGNSLLLVTLRSRLETALGRPVALKPLAEAASVSELAAWLADDTAASCLIRLQAGPKSPIYFIHGSGGGALTYRDLARAIDGEHAMYGFAARGLDSDEPPHASIEAMASHYLALARTVHPGGPFLLVGASLGGTVAYEMARQLTAAGDSVALCALLDSPGPGALPEIELDPADLLVFHLETRRWLAADALRGRPLDEQLQITLDTAHAAGVALPFTSLAHGRRHVAVWENNIRALRAYTAPVWGGAIDFFSPAEALPGSPTSHLDHAWRDRGALHVEVAGGDHLSMIAPPHASALGARIRTLIATRTRSTAP